MTTTNTIVMIRPFKFYLNEQTADSNDFQKKTNESLLSINEKAKMEFDEFVKILRQNEINVLVFDDRSSPETPDSIFPNNWFSTHEDGKVVLYPMMAENRRLERRMDIFDVLKEKNNFKLEEFVDLSGFEKDNKFLEGTGSLILDRKNKIAYCSLSVRSDENIAEIFAKKMSYELILFHTEYETGKPIYHTNVVMALGEDEVVVCFDTIKNPDEIDLLKKSFLKTNHEIIEISLDQLKHFAGNMLQLRNNKGELIWIMSKTAYDSLNEDQINRLSKNSKIVFSDISTIENYGGGSARCMMAEICLPTI